MAFDLGSVWIHYQFGTKSNKYFNFASNEQTTVVREAFQESIRLPEPFAVLLFWYLSCKPLTGFILLFWSIKGQQMNASLKPDHTCHDFKASVPWHDLTRGSPRSSQQKGSTMAKQQGNPLPSREWERGRQLCWHGDLPFKSFVSQQIQSGWLSDILFFMSHGVWIA